MTYENDKDIGGGKGKHDWDVNTSSTALKEVLHLDVEKPLVAVVRVSRHNIEVRAMAAKMI